MNFQYETELEFEEELCNATLDILVECYEDVPGSYDYDAPSDHDYYGYVEMSFDIYVIKVEKENGTEFYTNSKEIINELINGECNEHLYNKIYHWLLAELKEGK